MARFFFNFRQGEVIRPDENGSEFATVEDAYLEAFEAAQDIWRELLIERQDPAACAFEVSDDQGRNLFVLPFQEILDACKSGPRKDSSPRHDSFRPAALRTGEQRFVDEMRLLDLSRKPVFVWEFDTGSIMRWNRGAEELYGIARADAVGKNVASLLEPAAQRPHFEKLRTELARDGSWHGTLEHTVKRTPEKIDADLELITADGSRYVLARVLQDD